jgi:hypothetical protein
VTGDVTAIAFALLACAFALYKLLSAPGADPDYRPRRRERPPAQGPAAERQGGAEGEDPAAPLQETGLERPGRSS